MANAFRKNLHICLSKLKPTPPNPNPNTLSGIQNPKTHNSSENPDEFLFRHFNSLYTPIPTDSSDDSLSPPDFSSGSRSTDFTSDSGSFSDIPPGLSSVLASRRFFFSPGRSNSIVEEAGVADNPPERLTPPPEKVAVVEGGVAIPTYSPDPYLDFRRSMQEMVEAYGLDVGVDWDYLQELLLCYLKLNGEDNHKFIVGAFGDLVVSLTACPGSDISGVFRDFR